MHGFESRSCLQEILNFDLPLLIGEDRGEVLPSSRPSPKGEGDHGRYIFMEGRGPEFSPGMPEPTDDGFSEAKSAKATEGRLRDRPVVKKRKPTPQRPSRTPRVKSTIVKIAQRRDTTQ